LAPRLNRDGEQYVVLLGDDRIGQVRKGCGSLGSCQSPSREFAALPPANVAAATDGISLPDVCIYGPIIHPHSLYECCRCPCELNGTVRTEHYEVPHFDSITNLHLHERHRSVVPAGNLDTRDH
jgi:hypothetical protein